MELHSVSASKGECSRARGGLTPNFGTPTYHVPSHQPATWHSTVDSKLLGWLYFRSPTQPELPEVQYSSHQLATIPSHLRPARKSAYDILFVMGTTVRNKSFAGSTSGTAVRQQCTSVTVSNTLAAHAWPVVDFFHGNIVQCLTLFPRSHMPSECIS